MSNLNSGLDLGRSGVCHPSSESFGLGWLLWIVAFSTPWLLPTHAEPWTSFYSELLAAALMLPILGWGLFISKGAWLVNWSIIFIFLLSCVPIVQGVAGLLVFPSEAVLVVAYILAFAMAVLVGGQAEVAGTHKLIEGLFASLFIAALLSSGIALYQWFDLDWLGVLVVERGSARLGANVAQPNNLSTLLVWGVVAIWWGYIRQKVGGVGACLGVAFLLVGIALTQSRTGWLQLVFVMSLAFVWRDLFKFRRCIVFLLFFICWFVFWVLVVSADSADGGHGGGRLLSVGVRPQFWMMALEGVADKPLVGYGWNQITLVHVALADRFPGLVEVMGSAHNIFLDLLLWNGLFLGGLIILLAGWWCLKIVSSLRTPERVLLVVGVGVFLIHAMLELPHTYTFFLLPVGLMLGALTAGGGVVRVSRVVILVVGVVFSVLVVVIFNDYRSIEAEYTGYRMLAARIKGAEVPPPPNIFILRALHSALRDLRLEPRRHMLSTELDGLRATVIRYPVTNGLLKYARSAALNERPADAAWALNLVCNLRGASVCDTIVKEWQSSLIMGGFELGRVKLPIGYHRGIAD